MEPDPDPVVIHVQCASKVSHNDGTWQCEFTVIADSYDMVDYAEHFTGTPWGTITIGNLNEAGANHFAEGDDYYIELDATVEDTARTVEAAD